MRFRAAGLLCFLLNPVTLFAQASPEELIACGHWKRARALVEPRYRQNPSDPNLCFYLSQIRNAFGDRQSPLPLAEKAVAIDSATAKFHRQLAEVLGVTAQHSNFMQQLLLARRFRKELDTALALDPRDLQAQRDLLEFYLLAPGIAGGDLHKAGATADRIAQIDSVEGALAKARIAEHQKQNREMETELNAAVHSAPESYKARIALARFDLGASPPHRDAAREHALYAANLDPQRVDAYEILATLYAQGDDREALDTLLERAAQAVPDDLTPYFRAAEALSGKDGNRAEHYLRIYLQQEPEGNAPTASDARGMLARLRGVF